MRKRHAVFLLVVIAALTATTREGHAQAPEPTPAGSWQGTLTAGQTQLRFVCDISKSADGVYLGTLALADQPRRIPLGRIDVEGDRVRLEVTAVRATFTGVLANNSAEIRGTWVEGGMSYPLVLTRREAATTPPAVVAVPDRERLIPLPFELVAPVAPMPFQAGAQKHLVRIASHQSGRNRSASTAG